jgi:hypothetical protein
VQSQNGAGANQLLVLGPAERVSLVAGLVRHGGGGRSATTRHVVTVGQVLRWTGGVATTPGKRLKRNRLKAVCGRPVRRESVVVGLSTFSERGGADAASYPIADLTVSAIGPFQKLDPLPRFR